MNGGERCWFRAVFVKVCGCRVLEFHAGLNLDEVKLILKLKHPEAQSRFQVKQMGKVGEGPHQVYSVETELKNGTVAQDHFLGWCADFALASAWAKHECCEIKGVNIYG